MDKDSYYFEDFEDGVLVTIKSKPSDAETYLNDTFRGVTDAQFWLNPGKYRLKLIKSDYLPLEEEIEVSEGGNSEYIFKLSRASAIIQFNTTPSDAKIYVNSKEVKDGRIELVGGTYSLVVKSEGYNDYRNTITVFASKDDTYAINLTQQVGFATFEVNPVKARVILCKGSQVFQEWVGSKRIRGLPVGAYSLIVTMPGYRSLKKNFRLKKEEWLKITTYLEKGSDASNNFIFVEGGSFQMGGRDIDDFRKYDIWGDENPEHLVVLNSFFIDKYQLTQKEWFEIMGYNPSYNQGDNFPVEQISWFDAIDYCNKRSIKEGLTPCYSINGNTSPKNWISGTIFCNWGSNGYRLPTEAEWEYAAKGGKFSKGYEFAGSDEIEEVAWFCDDPGGDREHDTTYPVGKQKANELGLYDMSGNVAELCWDRYNADYYSNSPQNNPIGPESGQRRVVRGGGGDSVIHECDVQYREKISPAEKSCFMGIRLVKSSLVDRQTGTVIFEVNPMNAKVTLCRGSFIVHEWTGSKRISNLAVGEYSIAVSLPGYQRVIQRFMLKKNEYLNKAIFLQKGLDICSKFVLVEGGRFLAGNNGRDNESPQHLVVLNSFCISRYLLTHKEWKEIMKYPSYNNTDKCNEKEVAIMPWYDAIDYCNKRSVVEGLTPCYSINGNISPTDWRSGTIVCDWSANGYRLPTEAEWEYAAKGGKKSKGYKYSGSDKLVGWHTSNDYDYSDSENYDEEGWYIGNVDFRPHLVVKKMANELGLYEMSGNEREWCWDKYGPYSSNPQNNPKGHHSGFDRVLRGGGYYDNEDCYTVTYRSSVNVTDEYETHGVRLVRNCLSIKQIGNVVFNICPKGAKAVLSKENYVVLEWKKSIKIIDLPVGEYSFIVYKQGYKSFKQSFILNNDDILIKSVVLEEGLDISESFTFIEGGSFELGSILGKTDEMPVHSATINSFYMSKHQLTQKEWMEIMGSNPSLTDNINLPVVQVSWYDVVKYCNKRSIKEGLTPCYSIDGDTNPANLSSDNIVCDWSADGYRLPTETEWEYAARGGRLSKGYMYSGSNDKRELVWDESSPAGEKKANELGLYDMSSNISEWCWDKYGPYTKGFWSNPTGSENGLLRVIRGGSTVSNRDKNSPLYCVCYLGFRLVKSSTKVLNTGVIIFDINPENAKIVLSKDSMTIYESTGSQRISCLPVGEYELSVSMPGYKSLINRFVIKKSERLLKSVCLEKGPSIVNKFAFVEGGDFQMRRNKRRSFEEPVYTVTLNSFYISVFQITQKEWGEVMGSNPSNNKGDNLPVENITWFDVIIYCNKRSFQEGLTQCYSNDTSKNIFCNFDANGYRLPTEAEWVYAARGGKHSKGYKYSGSDDIEEVAWYNENSGDKTHPVGQKMPNELGLYDMSGNVLEWCWDWRDLCSIVFYNKPKCVMLGNDCVIRGGDYSKSSVECGLWYQNSCNFMHKHSGLGARLVRSRI